MERVTVPAQAGWDWLAEAPALLQRQPLAALAVGLVLGLAGLVPVVGPLLLALLLPPLYGALIVLLWSPRSGTLPADWLRQLRESDRPVPLLILSAAPLAIVLALWLLAWLLLGSAPMAGDVAGSNIAVAELGIGTLLMPIVAAVALVVLLLALFFAVPLVALHGHEAMPAMRLSHATGMANLPALLLLGLLLFLALLVVWVPLLLLGIGVGPALAGVVLHPLLAAAMAAGEREVFVRGQWPWRNPD